MTDPEVIPTVSDWLPRWIAPTLRIAEGRDPLGLQSATIDRLMPLLMPGVLELTQHARYLSFHAFLLAEYRSRRLPADRGSLSDFIRRCEWDFGLAVLMCPRNCGTSPVGSLRLKPLVGKGLDPYPRGASVESSLGGYGLYYRTPMEQFGVVARAGSLLGDIPIPIDVLRDTEPAQGLADSFAAAIQETEYVAQFMYSPDREMPEEVVVEYATAACLCRLDEYPKERDVIATVMFNTPRIELPDDEDEGLGWARASVAPDAVTRHRSFAVFLRQLSANPQVAFDSNARRDAIWRHDVADPGVRDVADAWTAVVAKDVWQDALCSIWSHLGRAGLAHQRQSGPLTGAELESLVGGLLDDEPQLDGGKHTQTVLAEVTQGGFDLDRDADPEALRQWTVEFDSATSGLITILALAEACRERSSRGWNVAAGLKPNWQPSLHSSLAELDIHLATNPLISETLSFVVRRFITTAHPRIGYSKMPEFTFRFRWEEGHMVFYDNGIGRFRLAGIRTDALSQLSLDLGLWIDQDAPHLTDTGRAFIDTCP